MKIIDGSISEGLVWRTLITLAPDEEPNPAWEIGLRLAKAHGGELVIAMMVANADQSVLERARLTLKECRDAFAVDDPITPLLIESANYRKSLEELINKANIDLVLATSTTTEWHNLDAISCAVAAVRGEAYRRPLNDDAEALIGGHPPREDGLRLLVPTSGGPNSVHALSFLLPLANHETEITALYIAPARLGANEEALGRARLRQTLNFIDANDRIESRLVTTNSVVEGIVDEASGDYDYVIIGASRESSLDKTLFGDIPGAVVRQSQKPVIVVRQPHDRMGNLFRSLSWAMQRIIPRMNLADRTQAYVRIRRGARPDIDFFVLIGLATAIAAFGLLANSPAVVIGAMLVAPLMSPIVGTGLSIVLGDTRFLRLSLGAVVRGVSLALIVGVLSGLLWVNRPLTQEVLARTQPTLLDLGIALFSGMAAAYAMCRSDAAAALPGVAIAAALVPPLGSAGIAFATGNPRQGVGAMLLFSTNFIAISSAAALVFLVLGFRPPADQKDRRLMQARSARLTLILLVVVTVVLAVTTYRLAQESATQTQIRRLAETGVEEIMNAELADIQIGNLNDPVLQLDVIVRATGTVPHAAVVQLQQDIATALQREVGLSLTVIPSTKLDPFVPPTFTPTPVPTNTATPGPTPTFTPTPTETPTVEPTMTPSATPTATATILPTNTPVPPTATATATPRTAVVTFPFGLNLRQEPTADSDLLTFLPQDTVVILLDGQAADDSGAWQEVMFDGLVGWVLAEYLG